MKISEIINECQRLTKTRTRLTEKKYLKMMEHAFGSIKIDKKYDRLLIRLAAQRLKERLKRKSFQSNK